jgi:SAM-dependent methyltransferase
MLAQRSQADEQMDADDLDPAVYARVVLDLAKVNRITMAARPTLDFLSRALGNATQFRLLDVGYGAGDMLRTIATWAEKRGLVADLVGIDLNPRSEPVARAATHRDAPIRYMTGDYADLANEPFDFIVSSLVAHHMTHAQLVSFIKAMDQQARRGWFINDLHRHGFAWAGYPLLATVMGWHPMVRQDGQVSIARSYRPGEWPPILEEAGVSGAHVFRRFPFRLCVEQIR